MHRLEKESLVESLREQFLSTQAVLVAHNNGLTVDQFTKLRTDLRQQGAKMRVTKNTLLRLAVKGTPYEGLDKYFTGPVNVTFIANDPVAASKSAVVFAKSNEKFQIVAGAIGTQVFDQSGVKALSELPSLDALRGKIVGLLQAPLSKLLGTLKAPAQNVVGVLSAAAKEWDDVQSRVAQK